jgi:hypothetical protein
VSYFVLRGEVAGEAEDEIGGGADEGIDLSVVGRHDGHVGCDHPARRRSVSRHRVALLRRATGSASSLGPAGSAIAFSTYPFAVDGIRSPTPSCCAA